jgi:hypothetical protein
MRRLAALSLALVAMSACTSDPDSPPPPAQFRTAQPIPAGTPAQCTSFGQTVDDVSGLGEAFRGQANTWVLDRDFSLATGYGLQFDYALVLYTGAPTGPVSHASLMDDLLAERLAYFPYDQDVSEAAFLTPLFRAADGVVTAVADDGASTGVPPLSLTRSGYLNGTPDSRLTRTLTLAAGQTYTFAWEQSVVLRAGNLVGAAAAPYAPAYQVVLRDPGTGAVIGDPLFASTAGVAAESRTAGPRAGLPTAVVLSFELRSAAEGYAVIDDVTLADATGAIALANGDFEGADLAPWVANDGAESRNVRSGARDVGAGASALRVTRTFHSPPRATWGRLVDVFENTGAATVTTKAVYLTTLGGTAPIAVVRQGGATVVAWDSDAAVRDVGLVIGDGTAYVQDGDAFVFVVHDLVVPAGGRTALAHFVVQRGEADGGLLASEFPPGTDGDCAAIAAGFPGTEAYAVDLEPGVLDLVQNF